MPRAKGGSIPPPREVVPAGHGGLISTLNSNDVLSGRGGRINNHPGNIMFRTVVEDYKHEYLDPRTRKLEKAHVAARLVAQIRSTNPPGRFLREDPDNPGKYVEIGDQKAWKKAGQALREDAPDVRKEIDEQEPKENGQANGQTDKTQQQPPYKQQRHDVPAGIPPSVSYSPSSQPMPPLPPPTTSGGGGGPRPDPPEAPGVTGYRQPPLRYFGSGRGGRGQQPPPFSGRGRGPPPPHHQQQYHPHPGYGSHQHRNYFNHPPHGQHYPPGPQYQHPPPQFQHHPSQQYPPQHGPPIQHGQPQFMPPQDKQSRKKSKSPTPPGILAPAHAVAAGVTAGVQQTMEAVSGVASKVGLSTRPNPLYQPKSKGSVRESRSKDFPPTMSLGTEFTMSDVSGFGESMKDSAQQQEAMVSELAEFLDSGDPANKHAGVSGGPGREEDPVSQGAHKHSSTSKDSSGKSDHSFTMSDLMGSNQTLGFGHSGRTRSFPDLMLSTGDLLPPLNDKEDSNEEKEETEQRTNSGRILRPPFHRHSSSESSNVSLGFHPVRGRTNTALSGINDAMSIMSLDSRKSAKSESSSWLDNFKSMQSIHSDNWGSSLRNQDDAASVKSFLSDVSNELSALDLADPLLPPINMDSGLSDSDIVMARPDP